MVINFICKIITNKIYNLESRVSEINEIFKNGIPESLNDNIGLHFSQLKGSKVTTSTVMATIASYLKNIEKP